MLSLSLSEPDIVVCTVPSTPPSTSLPYILAGVKGTRNGGRVAAGRHEPARDPVFPLLPIALSLSLPRGAGLFDFFQRAFYPFSPFSAGFLAPVPNRAGCPVSPCLTAAAFRRVPYDGLRPRPVSSLVRAVRAATARGTSLPCVLVCFLLGKTWKKT